MNEMTKLFVDGEAFSRKMWEEIEQRRKDNPDRDPVEILVEWVAEMDEWRAAVADG